MWKKVVILYNDLKIFTFHNGDIKSKFGFYVSNGKNCRLVKIKNYDI